METLVLAGTPGDSYIKTIKAIRAYTGLSLKETKALADRLRSGHTLGLVVPDADVGQAVEEFSSLGYTVGGMTGNVLEESLRLAAEAGMEALLELPAVRGAVVSHFKVQALKNLTKPEAE